MRYYKEMKDGKIFGYETRTDDIIPENEIEITQEEYNQALEELQAQIQEQNKDVPTYEELEKQNAELLYQVLTGEELDVTTN